MKLYPVVGLQTQGEIVEANFGTFPFKFDFPSLMAVSASHYLSRPKLTLSLCRRLEQRSRGQCYHIHWVTPKPNGRQRFTSLYLL